MSESAEPCQVCSKWKLPSIAMDAGIVRKNQNNELEILMITRGREPFKGQYAFPGGKMNYGEDPLAGVLRELEEECHLVGKDPQLVAVFGEPGRDPRKHFVSFLYSVEVDDFSTLKADDDAAGASFIPVNDILSGKIPLAFDHAEGVKKLVAWTEEHKSKKRRTLTETSSL